MILMPLTSRQGISGVALMTSSGSLVATSPRRPMTASPARRSGRSASQRSFPETHKFGGRIDRLGQVCEKVIDPSGHRSTASARMCSSRGLRALRATTSTPYTEEVLEILEQANMIKKRGTRLEVHQQIQVAVRASLSPGNGAKDGDPVNPAFLCYAENLRAAAAQPIQCQHVIRHSSRVSPDDPPAHERPIFRRLCRSAWVRCRSRTWSFCESRRLPCAMPTAAIRSRR